MGKYNFEMILDEQQIPGKMMRKIQPNSTVLEFGCAEGRMTRYMSEVLNCRVYIVEIDPNAYKIALKYAQDGICGDAEKLLWREAFKGVTFDYILFADVLEHLRDPRSVLDAAQELMREDGSVLVSIPNIAHSDIICNLMQNKFSYTSLGLLDDTHIHFWGKQDFAPFARSANLTVVEENASYLPVGRTEQKTEYSNLPIGIFSALLEKRYGTVYQFLFELKKSSWVHKYDVPLVSKLCDPYALKCTAYFDTGEGFTQEKSIMVPYSVTNTGEKTYYIKEIPAKCKAVRFDPVEGRGVILTGISAVSNLGRIECVPVDGECFGDEVFFCNADPQVLLPLPDGTKWLRIELRGCKPIYDDAIFNYLTEYKKRTSEAQNALTAYVERHQAMEQKQVGLECENQELSQKNQELKRSLAETNDLLDQIRQSDMYKLSQKYYKARDFLFPQDSGLRRNVRKLYNRVLKRNMILLESTNQIEAFHQLGKFSRMDIITTQHTLYVAKLYQKSLSKLSIECEIHIGEPEEYLDIPYIIICTQFIKKFPPVYIAVQMEQTVSSRWLTDEYYRTLQNSCAIMDYSLVNVEYYHKPQNRDVTSRVYYLPVDYYQDYTESGEKAGKEYDVVFYGDANSCPRRRAILDELSKKFNVKICSEVFGEDVYNIIRKAKVLVNIHYYEGSLLETTRLYETLSLNSCVIVSEESKDSAEDKRLEGIVDFVPVDDIQKLVERIEYWVNNDAVREQKVKDNKELLESRTSSFDFFFYRFLLAYDRISFEEFYRLAGDYLEINTNKLCLSLPESTVRRRSFDEDNHYGFQCVPGLRHKKGWIGCGLSYKYIFTKAMEKGYKNIMICEDDVIFPENFQKRLDKILHFLEARDRWSVFSGVMADVGNVNILSKHVKEDATFAEIDHMISMVFNIYNEEMFDHFVKWDEQDHNVTKNAIDRYLEQKDLSVWTQVPFLVGHKEELDSTIWGFNNSQYKDMIANSEKKLQEMISRPAEKNEK